MRSEFEHIPLVKNQDKKRFQITIDGHDAFIEYKETAQQTALVHTEVPEAIGGRGVAAALVEKTLNHLEAHHNTLLPICPYVFAYIKKHPEWKRLVDKRFKEYDNL